MKSTKAIITAVLFFLFTLTFSISFVSAAQQQKVTLRVDGLACPFCAYGMEKKLKRIENLEKLDIKINEGLVILFFKEGAKIDKELISKKVKEAGFTPGELKIEGEIKHEVDPAKGRKITLGIKGMSCEGCVSRVKSALSKLGCVQDVEVSLSAENASFICTDKKSDPDKFVKAVEKLGFEAKLVDDKQ